MKLNLIIGMMFISFVTIAAEGKRKPASGDFISFVDISRMNVRLMPADKIPQGSWEKAIQNECDVSRPFSTNITESKNGQILHVFCSAK